MKTRRISRVAMHKKKKKKKKTNEREQQKPRGVFDALQWVNKNPSSTFHGLKFLFETNWDFLLTDRHILKIGSEGRWKYIVLPIRDTNDNTSQCKSQ